MELPKKISELDAVTADAVAASDYLPIVLPEEVAVEDQNRRVRIDELGEVAGRYVTQVFADLPEIGTGDSPAALSGIKLMGGVNGAAIANLYDNSGMAPTNRLVWTNDYVGAPTIWREFGTGTPVTPDFDPAESVLEDGVRAFTVDGELRLWRATADLNPLDFPPTFEVPAPGTTGDWQELSPSEVDSGVAKYFITTAEAYDLLDTATYEAGKLYAVTDAIGGVVTLFALGPGQLHPKAVQGYSVGTFDVVSGIFTADVEFSGAYGDLTGKPTLGTAAALNVPAIGNATSGQVVLGSDGRLSDARAPTSHTHPSTDISDSTTTGRALVAAANAAAARSAIAAEDTAQKGAASGYAPLNSSSRVPTANLGSGTANAGTVLHGDGAWRPPAVAQVGDYGDGSDGALVVASGATVTLTRSMFYTTVTVQNGGTLITGNCKVFTTGDFTVDSGGVVHNDGNAGGNASGATGGTLGAAKPAIDVGGSGAGSTGGAGTTGAGAVGGVTSGATGIGGNTGTSGAGGGGAGNAGGPAVAAVSTALRFIRFRTQHLLIGAALMSGGSSSRGGASGGGDGTNSGAGGGGGPSGGGIIAIYCGGTLTNNGIIRSAGGKGGNGGVPTAGNCGGGSAAPGAGGGGIYIDCNAFAGTNPTCPGGAAGTGGAGTGTGTAGSNSTAGTAGNWIIFSRSTNTITSGNS